MVRKRLSDFQYALTQAKQQGIENTQRLDERLEKRLQAQKKEWVDDVGFNLGFTLTFRGALFDNGNIEADWKGGRDKTLALVMRFWNALDKHTYGKANVEKRNVRFKRIGIRQTGKGNINTHWHYTMDTDGVDISLFKARATNLWENILRAGYIEWNDDINTKQDAWTQYSCREITAVNSDTLCTHTTHF